MNQGREGRLARQRALSFLCVCVRLGLFSYSPMAQLFIGVLDNLSEGFPGLPCPFGELHLMNFCFVHFLSNFPFLERKRKL